MNTKLGDLYLESSLSQEEMEVLADSPSNSIQARMMRSYKEQIINHLRAEVQQGNLGKAQIFEGYIECLEATAEMLEGGLSEEIRENK